MKVSDIKKAEWRFILTLLILFVIAAFLVVYINQKYFLGSEISGFLMGVRNLLIWIVIMALIIAPVFFASLLSRYINPACDCPFCGFSLINASSKIEKTKCCQNCGKRIVDDKNNISKYVSVKTDNQPLIMVDVKEEEKLEISETRIFMALLIISLVLAGLASAFGF